MTIEAYREFPRVALPGAQAGKLEVTKVEAKMVGDLSPTSPP